MCFTLGPKAIYSFKYMKMEGFVVFDMPPNDDLLYLASMDNDGLVVNRVSVLDPNSAVN